MGYLEELRAQVGHRPLLSVGAIVLVFRDNRLLLNLRSDTGTWGVPGGGLELGETLEETAARELYEETGLRAKHFRMRTVLSGMDYRFVYPNGDELYGIPVLFEAENVTGELRILDDESRALAFFPLDALPELEPRAAKIIEWVRTHRSAVPAARAHANGTRTKRTGILQFRFARADDAEALAAIYAPYVRDTTVTFEYEPPDDAEFARRITRICKEYPYLVCVRDGRIVGFAYAHPWKERAAYGWNAELSVYLDAHARGCGIGGALYDALFALLRMQNVQNVYGVVTMPNEASVALHASRGFRKTGVQRQSGYKLGAWHDVLVLEKSLGEHGCPPPDFIPLRALDSARVAETLRRMSDEANAHEPALSSAEDDV